MLLDVKAVLSVISIFLFTISIWSMKRFVFKWFAVMLLIMVAVSVSWSQCPMCRMSAESNLQNGGTSGAGLNAGILYMLVAPYLIVGGIAFWWWRNRKSSSNETALHDLPDNSSTWN